MSYSKINWNEMSKREKILFVWNEIHEAYLRLNKAKMRYWIYILENLLEVKNNHYYL